MCGRYAITLPPEAVRAYFAYSETPNFPPRFNIAPTQPIPVVTAEARSSGAKRHFQLMRWGFLPGFVKDPKSYPLIINARAEKIAGKASYRAAMIRRRCLVISDGFYEWRRTSASGPKQPYLVRRVNDEPMGFAGPYETWSDPTGGEIDTACIITTSANRLMSSVHDRMPVILPREAFQAWLDVDGVDGETATALLKPAPENAIELIPIGTGVNHFANDDASVQTPVGEAIRSVGAASAVGSA